MREYVDKPSLSDVAPYTGAWIEIRLKHHFNVTKYVAPYTGAWIEILSDFG